jgi:general secretion pathway protein B
MRRLGLNESDNFMSLILDALKRSQQERDSVNDIPGIETHHPIDTLGPANGWRRYFPWGCLVLALAVIAWLMVDGNAKTNAPAAVVSSEAEKLAPKTVSSSKTSVKTQQKLTPLPAEKATQRVPVVDQPEHDAKAAAVENLYKEKAQEQGTAPQVENETTPQGKIQTKAVVEDQSTVTERAVDIEKIIALAKSETANAGLADHSAAFLSELSQHVKDQIPTIYYTQHDFSSGSPQSSVTLNGEVLRAGSSLGSTGLKVDEILPASVVLSHRGTQFRLKALNSWINL